MKIVHADPGLHEEKKNDLLERIQQSVGPASSAKEAKAQDILIRMMGKSLDNRYVLLRGVHLDDVETRIPLTLVGPTGLHVFHASPLKGLFHVKEDSWEKLDERTRKYVPEHPNLVARIQDMAQRLQVRLADKGLPVKSIEPVLVFPEPGFHVDTVRPAARILSSDAIERFIAGLLQSPPDLSAETVQRIVVLLSGEAQPPPAAESEREDAFSYREVVDEKKLAKQRQAARENKVPLSKRIPLTDRQLAILGGMLFATVILLFAAMIVVWYYVLR